LQKRREEKRREEKRRARPSCSVCSSHIG
jgi:hypothetical protein